MHAGEDFTAAMNAGAATVTGGMAKASTALFAGIASLKVQAVRAGNSISIRRVDAEENQGRLLFCKHILWQAAAGEPQSIVCLLHPGG